MTSTRSNIGTTLECVAPIRLCKYRLQPEKCCRAMKTIELSTRTPSVMPSFSVTVVKTFVILMCWTMASFPLTVEAGTYQLTHDSIVPSSYVRKHTNQYSNENNVRPYYSLVPPTIAEEVSKLLGAKFLALRTDSNHSIGEQALEEAISLNCFPLESYEDQPGGATCFVDHRSPGLFFTIHVTVEKVEGSMKDYLHTKGDEPSQKAESEVPPEPLEPHSVPILMSIDITMTAAEPTYARNRLVEAVLVISKTTRAVMPVWTVRERPSPLEVFKRQQQEHDGDKASNDQHNETVANRPDGPASINSIIFSNLNAADRRQIVPPSSDSSIVNGDDSIDVATSSDNERKTDIWSYREAGHKDPTQAVFLNSSLRATTNIAGNAHAEAFVHPALISHEEPERVAVISTTPLAYVKEILKHTTVKTITVVGADMYTLELTRNLLPELDDCRAFVNVAEKCLDDKSVNLVTENVADWLNSAVEIVENEMETTDPEDRETQYDVILLDVPQSDSELSNEWLSMSFHLKLKKLMTETAVLIVNAGSAPSMDRDIEKFGSEYEARDYFLRQVTRRLSVGGLNYSTAMVYDETLAAPLDTTFIAVFASWNESYIRFIRKTPAAIDLDMVERFDSRLTMPTFVYDGPTHLSYVNPSRAWESWYCRSSPGRDMFICKTFLQKWFNHKHHSLKTEVRHDPVKGRSLYAAEEIAEGNFVLAHDIYLSMRLDALQWYELNKFADKFPDAKMYQDLRNFYTAYGFESETLGSSGWSVSIACNNTFTNHACTEEERQVSPMTDADWDEDGEEIGFSPVITRRPETIGQLTVALKDMKKGQEIMMDYSAFRSEKEPEYIKFLSQVCSNGEGLVPIIGQSGAEEQDVGDEL